MKTKTKSTIIEAAKHVTLRKHLKGNNLVKGGLQITSNSRENVPDRTFH